MTLFAIVDEDTGELVGVYTSFDAANRDCARYCESRYGIEPEMCECVRIDEFLSDRAYPYCSWSF